jgi:hypothetical protein
MPRSFEFKQNGHLNPVLLNRETRSLNSDKLTGRWVNTNRDTKGIAEVVIEKDGDDFNVSVAGVAPGGVISWPICKASALANLEEEAGQQTIALVATFDLSFMSAEAYLRVNKGVLVTVLFTTFHDNSERANYVEREFFYREDRVR